MAFKLQVSDARNDPGLRAISGVCNDSARFLAYLNQATRQLMKRGGFFGTEVLARFCIHSCGITFPRYVSTIIGARTCNGTADIQNNWFSILGPGRCHDWLNGNVTFVDDGTAPTYNEISGTTGKKIAYHVTKNSDIGKAITIYGIQAGGQPLQELDANGQWKMGVTITASAAGGVILPAMTTQLVTKITSITREATGGMAYLYSYGPDANGTNALIDLAAYEPAETRPQYRRSKISGYCSIPGRTDSYGRLVKQVEAMVSLEFIPLVSENDFLLIDDLDALAFAIQAIKKNEAGDAEGAEIFFEKAVRELNYLDRKKSPSSQLVTRVNVMGGRAITNPF